MTEFLDGVLCRNHEDWTNIDLVIDDMMDFAAYNHLSAPASCP